MALEEFLGERLGAFELRGACARPEALQAARLERIDDAGDERPFGPDDREIDALALRKPHEARRCPRRRRRRCAPCGSVAVPALPGATSTSLTRADCAHFHASACSRPPEPTMRTFIAINA